MIKLLVGMDTQDAMAELRLLTDRIGLHNVVLPLFIGTLVARRKRSLFKPTQRIPSKCDRYGFFDDEQVSFAHTIANLNNQTPIFCIKQKRQHPYPAVISRQWAIP